MCNVCEMSVIHVHVCSMCVGCLCDVCAVCVRCLCDVCAVCAQCLHGICAVCIQCMGVLENYFSAFSWLLMHGVFAMSGRCVCM
jgi:hypothetical protein